MSFFKQNILQEPISPTSPGSTIAAAMSAGAGAASMVARKPIQMPKKSPEQLMRRYQEQVDGNALVLFPLSFLLFNIGYELKEANLERAVFT